MLLFLVAPPGLAIGVPLGEQWLPRGSVIKSIEAECEGGGVGVEVVTVDPWHRDAGVSLVSPGDTGCVSEHALTANSPATRGRVAATLRGPVVDAFEQRFGSIDGYELGATDWGRVSPPLKYFSDAEIAAQYGPERMATEKQREKAIVATGPSVDGVPVYLHFLGSDAPRSDVWGDPEMVVGLLALADEWFTHCAAEISPDAPESCTLQFGDLSWYGPARPDPLGHQPGHLGRCVDIRLFRGDGSRYEAWWNKPDDREGVSGGYSQTLSRAFLAYAVANHAVSSVYFNDPEVYAAVDGVEPLGGHDDHIHMCW